jgi:glycine cleavage system H protein
VDGEIIAVNPKIQASPELLNSDPHGDAWLIRVRLADRGDIEGLMTAEEYEAYIAAEKAH